MADLEHILQQLHDSETNAGMQTFYDAGMRAWIGDEANGIQAETVINRTPAARLKWPEGLTAASWLHETAVSDESTFCSQCWSSHTIATDSPQWRRHK
jgi:hypothetical protein